MHLSAFEVLRSNSPTDFLKCFKVNISWKPRNVKIETPRNTLDLAAYEQYELICSADANPPASFTWKIRHPNTTNPVLKHWNFNQGNSLFRSSIFLGPGLPGNSIKFSGNSF